MKQTNNFYLIVYWDQLIGYEKYITKECPIIENDRIRISNYIEIKCPFNDIEQTISQNMKYFWRENYPNHEFFEFPVNNLFQFKLIQI